jgi:hypothetical protein
VCLHDNQRYDGVIEEFFMSSKAGQESTIISADIVWEIDDTASRAKIKTFQPPGKKRPKPSGSQQSPDTGGCINMDWCISLETGLPILRTGAGWLLATVEGDCLR